MSRRRAASSAPRAPSPTTRNHPAPSSPPALSSPRNAAIAPTAARSLARQALAARAILLGLLLAPLAQLRLRGFPSLLLVAPARQPPLSRRFGQARLRRAGGRLAPPPAPAATRRARRRSGPASRARSRRPSTSRRTASRSGAPRRRSRVTHETIRPTGRGYSILPWPRRRVELTGRAASYAACANDFMKSARARAPATGIAL